MAKINVNLKKITSTHLSQYCNTVNNRAIAGSVHINVYLTCVGGQNTVHIYCVHLTVSLILCFCGRSNLSGVIFKPTGLSIHRYK
jgi:hypothetical protein